jgi:hypothetical protein
MRFGFVGPSYRSQSVNADCQTCMNLYVESVESGQGKGPLVFLQTPGLNKLYDLGAAGVRGEITAQGRTFAVAGTVLWELLPPNSKAGDAGTDRINRGAVVSDGQPVSMASGPTQVLIASAGNLYCFQLVAGTTTTGTGAILAANSLTQIPNYNNSTGYGLLGPVSQAIYSDSFFTVLIVNSNQVQTSNSFDGSSFQGVTETQVSVFADNIVAIFMNARYPWVFGPKGIQPYYPSGNFPFPYDIVQGAYIEQGLAAPFSVAKLDNSIFWIGSDERGNGIVWRANGYTPQRVSTHAIEYALGTYATIADAVCFAYQDQGHTFYVMNFPTAQKTWVYDCATQMWHERGFWSTAGGNGKFLMSRAGCHTFNFGIHLVGDPTTGAVYQQAVNIYSDFGNPIRRLRRAPHISNEQALISHTELQLDVEVGLGPTFQGAADPTVIPLLDAAGALRNFQMGENGILQAPLNAPGDVSNATTLYMNDLANATSWQITINAQGEIAPVLQAKFVDSYPQAISFVTALGDQNYTLQLENLGNGIGVLQAIPQGMVGRGPLVTLKWSNDGARTWSNGYDRDCGQAGAFRARVIWRRLGQARDRVYEISITDPVPWRIVDAYLFTDPEDKAPTSRFAVEARKRA